MKIAINQISPEGVTLNEEFAPQALDLETDIIKFSGPIQVKAEVSRVFNVVTARLSLNAPMQLSCGRCLEEFESDFKKNLEFNYPVNNLEPAIDPSTSLRVNGERSRTIDLDPEIREEIILDYPIKPLCSPNCKGLCPKCGKNLNEGGCSCGST